MRIKKMPERFYVSPGIPMVNCPNCRRRPFFQSRRVPSSQVICPHTGKRYILLAHYQFTVGCVCNPYPFKWGPDLWNTAKAWRRRILSLFGSGTTGQFMKEEYDGTLFPGIQVLSEVEIRERYPEWVVCLSPDENNFQPVPVDIGPEGVSYPTQKWFREGVF